MTKEEFLQEITAEMKQLDDIIHNLENAPTSKDGKDNAVTILKLKAERAKLLIEKVQLCFS